MLSATVIGRADPLGGQVVSGHGSIVQTGATTTVAQTSPTLSLAWTSFNIGPQETVNFLQPSASAIAVNRIADTNGTQILGHLNANGQVYLINPNGILFGSGAQVNVGGLIASTLDLDEASLGQSARPFRGDGAGSIINQGTITAANGGYVALLGHRVSNQGTITAPLGTVGLGAGSAMTLTFNDNSLVQLQVDQGMLNTLAENGGMLRADGGLVIMTAGAKNALLASVVNNTGVIQAHTVDNRGGRIILLGGQAAGTVTTSGTIDATGAGAGQTGGSVELLAGHVGLLDHASVDVSGVAGGGTVLVGGDLQGMNPAVPNASATYLGADAGIFADALTQGDGGKVILWGNDSTRAYGRVSAHGGALGGDGGLIETSGHWLDVEGLSVDAGAANGRRGMWLLDPADVTITSGITSGGVFSGGTPNIFAPNSAVATANVNVGTLAAALVTSDVTVTSTNTGTPGAGNGDITVGAAITWTAPTVLTLTAVRDVTINSAITGTNGSFIANAGRNVNVEAAVTTTTGSVTANALNDVNLNAAMTTTTGNVNAIASNNVNLTATLTVVTGSVVLRSDNDGTSAGGAILGGTVNITGAGTMGITTGVANIRFNPAGYANTDAEILAYGGKLTGTGTLDARGWVFATASDKVYNGTVAATARFRSDPTVGGTKAVALNGGTMSFADRNAGAAKSVTFNGFTISGADSADYALFAGSGTSTAAITPALMTVTAQTATKAYDATTSSAVLPLITSGALQSGDTTTTFAQTYDTANAGVGKTLTPAGIVNDGNLGANYAYTFVANNTGVITPAPVTVTNVTITGTVANNKVYDGNTLATFSNIGTVTTGVGAETLVLNGPAAANINFNTKDVATANLVTGTGYSISDGTGGGLAANYALTSTSSSAPANITPKSVNLSGSRVYDGTTNIAAGILTIGSLVGSETLALAGTGTVASATVGNAKPLTLGTLALGNGTGLASNYTFTGGTHTASITPAAVTVTGVTITGTVANNKVYDGNTLATFSNIGTVTTGVGAETLVLNGPAAANINFNTKDVATANLVTGTGYSISDGTGGGLAANYALTSTSSSAPAKITPKPVNLSGSRTYDGSTNIAAGMLAIGSLVGSETLTLSGTGTVANHNVGTAKPLTLGTLALGNGTGLASNYTFTGGTQTASITAASLTLSTTDVVKVYDGGVSAMGTAVVTNGTLFSGDALSGGTFAYTTPTVGLGNKTVTTSGVTVTDGNSGANYLVGYANNTTSTISPPQILSIYASIHPHGLSLSPTIAVSGAFDPAPLFPIEAFSLETNSGVALNTTTMNNSRHGPVLEIVDTSPGLGDLAITRIPRDAATQSNQ